MTDMLIEPEFAPALDADERSELEAYRAAFSELTRACDRAARGDLEVRVPMLVGNAEIQGVRNALNGLLDLTDAFVREAGASLQAASERRFHRAFLVRGMRGAFRDGAETVNRGREAMRRTADELAETERHRLRLADGFEDAVLSASEQVAAASTELGATAGVIAKSTQAAVEESDRATATIATLDASSRQIQQVVTLINQVAAQTRLLALNATIEAARAGEAGRGFGVVATEVKSLADQTAEATARIEGEVNGVQEAAEEAGRVLVEISNTIRSMHQEVTAISDAVNGGGGNSTAVDMSGLSQLAEILRSEVTGFLAELRS